MANLPLNDLPAPPAGSLFLSLHQIDTIGSRIKQAAGILHLAGEAASGHLEPFTDAMWGADALLQRASKTLYDKPPGRLEYSLDEQDAITTAIQQCHGVIAVASAAEVSVEAVDLSSAMWAAESLLEEALALFSRTGTEAGEVDHA